MLVENNFLSFLDFINVSFAAEAFLVLFLIFYSIFSLVIFRQIQLMCKTLPGQLSPVLKSLAIIHIGVSIALLFIVLGTF